MYQTETDAGALDLTAVPLDPLAVLRRFDRLYGDRLPHRSAWHPAGPQPGYLARRGDATPEQSAARLRAAA